MLFWSKLIQINPNFSLESGFLIVHNIVLCKNIWTKFTAKKNLKITILDLNRSLSDPSLVNIYQYLTKSKVSVIFRHFSQYYCIQVNVPKISTNVYWKIGKRRLFSFMLLASKIAIRCIKICIQINILLLLVRKKQLVKNQIFLNCLLFSSKISFKTGKITTYVLSKQQEH